MAWAFGGSLGGRPAIGLHGLRGAVGARLRPAAPLAPRPRRPAPPLPGRAPRAPAPTAKRATDGGGGADAPPPSPLEQQLRDANYQSLLRLAGARGLPLRARDKVTKAEVVDALLESYAAEGVTQLPDDAFPEPKRRTTRRTTAAPADPEPPPPPPPLPPPAAGAPRLSRAEVLQELKRELSVFEYDQLVDGLKARGLSAKGGAEVLVDRLAEAVVREQAAELNLEDEDAAAPGGAAAPPPPLPASEREWLLADRQQQLVDELLEVAREELVSLLEQAGEEVDPQEPQEDLARRASWVLAAEEVELMEAQQAAGAPPPGVAADGRRAPGAPALQGGQPPGLFYGEKALLLDNMTGADVRMMKVKDLREVLRTLGLSEEGGRYECRDRLLTVLAAHQAVKQGNRPALMAELSKMTLRELRDELRMRGESDEGTKGELEKRLSSAALVAAGHEEAALTEADSATAAAAAAIAAAAKQGADVLLDQYNESEHRVLRTEPAATVLLLAGGAGAACGAGVGAAAAPAAQLSLEAAR
ncbi:MAG: hypothetical protein J3K34DRAFT_485526, partial [Monoraphidium minutum]